jgi:hypothetical protein
VLYGGFGSVQNVLALATCAVGHKHITRPPECLNLSRKDAIIAIVVSNRGHGTQTISKGYCGPAFSLPQEAPDKFASDVSSISRRTTVSAEEHFATLFQTRSNEVRRDDDLRLQIR